MLALVCQRPAPYHLSSALRSISQRRAECRDQANHLICCVKLRIAHELRHWCRLHVLSSNRRIGLCQLLFNGNRSPLFIDYSRQPSGRHSGGFRSRREGEASRVQSNSKSKRGDQQSYVQSRPQACLMGRVRFASETTVPRNPDISRWPGVYIHPGDFRPATANVKDEGEAWIRYRNRYRRLQAHRHLPKAERRRRQREIVFVTDGHCRFCRCSWNERC